MSLICVTMWYLVSQDSVQNSCTLTYQLAMPCLMRGAMRVGEVCYTVFLLLLIDAVKQDRCRTLRHSCLAALPCKASDGLSASECAMKCH